MYRQLREKTLPFSGGQAREARQRRTMGKKFREIDRIQEILVMTSTYFRPPVQTVGVGVGRKDGLWGRGCSLKFPWREIAWPGMHLASRIFLAGNHIDCRGSILKRIWSTFIRLVVATRCSNFFFVARQVVRGM